MECVRKVSVTEVNLTDIPEDTQEISRINVKRVEKVSSEERGMSPTRGSTRARNRLSAEFVTEDIGTKES